MNIFSKVEDGKLLHIVNRLSDIGGERNDLVPSDNPLQVSAFKMENKKTFKPHKHIKNVKMTKITQESWVVVEGKVKVILYDLDDSVLFEGVLCKGDCSITLYGGHNYECLEDNSIVYEYKTGPYFGQEKDKVFL